ncbi:MAG: hypothetical protein J6M21_00500 [Campylobacter sp.]|nr:hypothetical protein [Campylobacter sp.]
MKRIIIYLMVILAITRADEIEIKKSNTKYEFGKNVNLIGTWEITETNCCPSFIFGRYDKITAKFAKDGKIYKIENGKEILSDMIYEIENNGNVKVMKNDEFYEKSNINNVSKKSIQGKVIKEIIKGVTTTNFSIVEKAPNSCFFIQNQLKMCKKIGKVYLDSDKKIDIKFN